MTIARERAPYGRREESWAERPPGETRRGERERQPYAGPTYYELPAIKASHYRWLVVSYLFVGGLAGAAQLIATLADLAGRRRDRALVRGGRYLALAGALLSPALLT